MLKQSSPSVPLATIQEEIYGIFQRGDFDKGVQACREAKRPFGEFQNAINEGAINLMASRRAGVVLNFMAKYNIRVDCETPMLLQSVFDAGDYHGFLKNIHRFKIMDGFDQEILTAVERLTEKGHSPDALAWQKKIQTMRQQ